MTAVTTEVPPEGETNARLASYENTNNKTVAAPKANPISRDIKATKVARDCVIAEDRHEICRTQVDVLYHQNCKATSGLITFIWWGAGAVLGVITPDLEKL